MVSDIVLNKVSSIERCIQRVREEYNKSGSHFSEDYTRQDAAILNIQRACEAALDIGQHLIREYRLGIPQSARDVFELLKKADYIDAETADVMKRMIGFRNIAVHDYQTLLIPIVEKIVQTHLDDFLNYSKQILKKAI